MRPLSIDTSGYSLFKDGHPGAIAAIGTAQQILMPSITLGELHAGFENGTRRERNRHELSLFLASPRVLVVDVDAVSAENYGLLYAYLRRQGTPIPTNDIWLAAITMQHGAKLLTADKHFQNMPQIVSQLLK